LDEQKSNEPPKTVRDAIGDLPKFRELEEPYKIGNTNISHELDTKC
jgi:DNA (cytosine-5)-methyltransferase 1